MSTAAAAEQKTHAKPVEQADRKDSGVMAVFSNILKEIVEFKGWELIFQVLMYGFVLWAALNIKAIYEFHTSPEYAHIDKFSIYDFKLSLVFAVLFQVWKMFCRKVFHNIIYNQLDPTKFPTHEERDKRAAYSCIWVSNIIYYSLTTVFGFYLFINEDFFPESLGGRGKPLDVFKGLPHAPRFAYGTLFYMVQFGCHLHTLVDYCVHKWRDPKFWEMFLHHILAVQLIFYSYMINNIQIGIMVLIVHDPSDIFLCLNRLISDSKNKKMVYQGIAYAVFMWSWIFFRLYTFPKYITNAALEFSFDSRHGILFPVYAFLSLMLVTLVILHIYWFTIALRVFVMMIAGKKEYNVYDNKQKDKKN